MKFTAPFLIADGEVDDTFEKFVSTGVTCPDELPVTLDFQEDLHHRLGTVKVRRKGDTFIGDFDLNDDMVALHEPELIQYYYPAISGWAKETNRLDGGVKEITHCIVHSVSLSHTRNCDSRIKRIKDSK